MVERLIFCLVNVVEVILVQVVSLLTRVILDHVKMVDNAQQLVNLILFVCVQLYLQVFFVKYRIEKMLVMIKISYIALC
jgi:hypothetical protein